MAGTDTEDRLWSALHSGFCRSTLGILADWYADQGDESLAFALRWCRGRGRWPQWVSALESGRYMSHWRWASLGAGEPLEGSPPHRLPAILLRAMRGDTEAHTLREAVAHLAACLDQARDAIRVESERGV